MKPGWGRPGAAVAAVTMALAALVLWRVASESSTELAAAQAYRDDERPLLAVEHYRRAIRWSLPLSPHTAEAVSALLEAGANVDAIARDGRTASDVAKLEGFDGIVTLLAR